MLRSFVKDNEETFDEHNIRDFIDAFLLEMKKKTNESFTVSSSKILESQIEPFSGRRV